MFVMRLCHNYDANKPMEERVIWYNEIDQYLKVAIFLKSPYLPYFFNVLENLELNPPSAKTLKNVLPNMDFLGILVC